MMRRPCKEQGYAFASVQDSIAAFVPAPLIVRQA